MKTLGLLLALIGIYGLVDAIDRATEERIAFHTFVREACVPAQRGERAVATHDGARITCTIYQNYERGRVPVIVSAAVMDVPQ